MLLDEMRDSTPLRQPVGASDEAGYTSFSYRLAQEILSAVPAGAVSRLEDYPDRIQVRIVPGDGGRLQRVILGRESLEKLAADPQRDVKVEYLKRELAQAVSSRRIWAYPRTLAQR